MIRALRLPVTGKVVLLMSAVAGIATLLTVALAARFQPGPAQPIPFSHRIHVGTKHLNCIFCHPNTFNSANAGIPPVEKCLLCHDFIAPNFKPIARIQDYNRRGEGIPWVRVNQLPQFVHFSHKPHIAGGHDCSECHGNVKAMDRVKQVYTLDMNFCITCHRQNKVSVDCYVCHY